MSTVTGTRVPLRTRLSSYTYARLPALGRVQSIPCEHEGFRLYFPDHCRLEEYTYSWPSRLASVTGVRGSNHATLAALPVVNILCRRERLATGAGAAALAIFVELVCETLGFGGDVQPRGTGTGDAVTTRLPDQAPRELPR